jgi:dTMP kinase
MKQGYFYTLEGGEGTGKTHQAHNITKWAVENDLRVLTSREPGGTKRGEIIRAVLMKIKAEDHSEENFNVINMSIWELGEIIDNSGFAPDGLADYVRRLSKQRIITPDLEITLFILSRIFHCQEIMEPFLAGKLDADLLLVDRFWHSTYAYQIFTRGKSFETLELFTFMNDIFDWHVEYLRQKEIVPNVLLLDVDPKIGLGRVGMRGGQMTTFDKEQLPFHFSVRNGFWDLARNSRVGHSMARYSANVTLFDATPSIEIVSENIINHISSMIESSSQKNFG